MEGFPIQTNFTAGEVSPLLHGRVDVNKYFNGAQKLQNIIVKPQGAAVRRSGTRFADETKTSSKLSVLQKFVYSATQAYMLEFGDLYIRIYKDGALLKSAGTPIEVTTTYTEAELRDLYFAQSADILYISHPNHPPATLSRVSETSWVLANIAFTDGPYQDEDDTGNELKIELISDNTTILSSASGSTTAIASAALFNSGHVNRYVEYLDKTISIAGFPFNVWGLAQITAYTSTTNVAATIQSNVLTPSPLTSLTFSAGQVHSSLTIFKSSHVGKFVRLSASQAWYQITSFVNSTTVGASALTLVTYTYPTTKVTIQAGFVSGDVGKYVEYRDGNRWKLAKISSITSEVEAVVAVQDNVVIPESIYAEIKVPAGANQDTTANFSSVFAPSDVRKNVRDTDSAPGRWAIIKDFVNTEKVTTDEITMVAYTYPAITMSLQGNRVITVNLKFKNEVLTVEDIGVSIRVAFGAEWRYITISDVLSTTQATGIINDFIPRDPFNNQLYYNNGFVDQFRLPAWSKARGYPGVVFFHEERLGFSGSTAQPLTSWLGKSSDFYNYGPTDFQGRVAEDSAITYTIASAEVNKIRWGISSIVLLLGTNGSEWQTKASTINQPITPTNIAVVEPTAYGSIESVKPIKIGSSVLFVQKSGTQLRELVYDFQQDSLVAHDLNVVSEHIIKEYGYVVQTAYQKSPSSIFWLATSQGALVGVTLEKDQEVTAWHRHIIGGSFSTGIAVVESIATMPSADGKSDILYMIVKRTINGSTKRYVEYMEKEFSSSLGNAGMFFVDCGLSYSGVAVSSVTGLNHLEGQTVQIVANGTQRNDAVVTAGAVTVSGTSATSIHVGLRNNAVFKSLPLESGSISGTAQGKKKRIHRILIRVFETMGLKYGPTETNLKALAPGTSMYSGIYDFDLSADYDNDAVYVIVQDKPLPLTLLAIMPQLQTYQ